MYLREDTLLPDAQPNTSLLAQHLSLSPRFHFCLAPLIYQRRVDPTAHDQPSTTPHPPPPPPTPPALDQMAHRPPTTRRRGRRARSDRPSTRSSNRDGYTYRQHNGDELLYSHDGAAEASRTTTTETDSRTYSSSRHRASTAVTVPEEGPPAPRHHQQHRQQQHHRPRLVVGSSSEDYLNHFINHDYFAVQQRPALTVGAMATLEHDFATTYHNNITRWMAVQPHVSIGDQTATMYMETQTRTSVVVHTSSTVRSSGAMVTAPALPASRMEGMAEDVCGAGLRFDDEVAPPRHGLANEDFV
ncbi:hypothetical protein F4861DRAFT_71907 [Xylaria intraflava]|nr:hypothetical protein F4861DRAFT_71907 [Xylaria intraflava]